MDTKNSIPNKELPPNFSRFLNSNIRGIGSVLIYAMGQIAKERSLSHAATLVVEPTKDAFKFYAKLGFFIEAGLRSQDPGTCCVMKMSVTEEGLAKIQSAFVKYHVETRPTTDELCPKTSLSNPFSATHMIGPFTHKAR